MSEATVIAEATQAVEPATQASPATEAPNLGNLDEALALLDEVEGKKATQGEARTEAEPHSTGPEADEDELAAVKAAREAGAEEARAQTREEIAKEAEQQTERENYRKQVEGIHQSFQQRAGRIRAALEGIQNGSVELTPQLANAFLEEFNAHHAQSALVANKDYWDSTIAYAKTALPADAAKNLTEAANKGEYKTHKNLLDAIVDAKVKDARTGHYTEAQVREKEATATLKALKKFQADPDRYLSRTRTATSRDFGAASSGPRNLAEAELMHAGMHPSGKTITSTEMRALKARFGSK